MQVGPISTTVPSSSSTSSTSQATNDAFGLGFEQLLKIILTQLSYQDPLKPMDNFEFVSQLAQFSQIQIGQTTNDRLEAMAGAAAVNQATGLLGRIVEVPAGSITLSGRVKSIAITAGEPRITIQTSENQTISNIAISSITQVKEGN